MANEKRRLMTRLWRASDAGQAVVEMAIMVPILMLIVFGVAELTQAYSVAVTIAASTREGVRVAGALVNGGGTLGCPPGVPGGSPNRDTVDPQIIAAIERVLTASGTGVALSDVSEIKIYKSNPVGKEIGGKVNQFTYSLNGGPVVDGQPTDFVAATNDWPACSRSNTSPADPVGVRLSYTYRGRTPLRWIIPFLATIPIADYAVMDLNATR